MKRSNAVLLLLVVLFARATFAETVDERIRGKIQALASGDFYQNQIVIKEINSFGEQATPLLLAHLSNENANIRRYVAQAIGDVGIKTDTVLTTVLGRLQQETDQDVTVNLIYILDVLNDGRALTGLQRILENPSQSETVRYRAAYAIARLASPSSFDILKKFLFDPSLFIRKSALWGLGLSKDAEAKQLVLPIFENQQEPIIVRYWAGRALQDLGEVVDLESFRREYENKLIYVRNRADYSIRTDLSEKVIDEIEAQFALVQTFLEGFFATRSRRTTAGTRVLFFRSEQDFRDYTEMFYPSFHASGGGYIPSEKLLITYDREDHDRAIKLIKHEWTHRFIDYFVYNTYWQNEDLAVFFRGFPIWFDEGLAEYVAYYDFENKKPGIATQYASDLIRQADGGTLPHVRDLIVDEDPYKFGARYAEYWGLTYFLLHGQGGELPVVRFIVKAMVDGSTSINDAAFREMGDIGAFQLTWQTFIKQQWGSLTAPITPPITEQSVCSDSDSGDSPASRGALQATNPSVFWHGYADYCVDATTLVEMQCDPARQGYAFTYVNCGALGGSCRDGICVQQRVGEGKELLDPAPPSPALSSPLPSGISRLTLPASVSTKRDLKLVRRLKGRILLQVEKNGAAWYLHPFKLQRYALGKPDEAFARLRSQGTLITDDELRGIPEAGKAARGKLSVRRRYAGQVLLRLTDPKEAWYVNPVNLRRYPLQNGRDAFQLMRTLSIGITNSDLEKIPVAE